MKSESVRKSLCANKEYRDVDCRYACDPSAYRPVFMLALAMKILNTPWYRLLRLTPASY